MLSLCSSKNIIPRGPDLAHTDAISPEAASSASDAIMAKAATAAVAASSASEAPPRRNPPDVKMGSRSLERTAAFKARRDAPTHIRLAQVAVALRQFSQDTAYQHTFPDALENQTAEGPWLQEFHSDLLKVLAATKKKKEAAGIPRPEAQQESYKPPSERSFLERHVNDSSLQRKCIVAMLESDSACGGSPTLLRMRRNVLTLFEAGPLPDPDCYGHESLSSGRLETDFQGSLALFYHHVSEHHCGEIVEIQRSTLTTLVPHPFLPDAHAPQFFHKDTDPKILTVAEQFFKDPWWKKKPREEEHGQSVATQKSKELAVEDFLEKMKDVSNTVWRPVRSTTWMPLGRMKVPQNIVSWHTLDSLVWAWAHCDDAPACSFGDLYLFYTRSTLLAYKRRHGKRSSKAKDKGKSKGKYEAKNEKGSWGEQWKGRSRW